MINLAIEDHPEILQEYGRAFACMSAVEEFLSIVIRAKDKTKTQADLEIPLGSKIKLLKEGWLDKTLIQKLNSLNDDRIKLAHGVIGEVVDDPKNPHVSSGKFVLKHRNEGKLFDKGFLIKVIEEAKAIMGELYQAMPIPKEYKIS